MYANDAQKEAIKHKDGPMMVLAGPGSGKTFVITQRTKILIEDYGVNPSNILVITFTKAAASEMQERFKKLMGGRSLPVTFGTFHAVFFKILKLAYHYQAENIIREDQKHACIREIVRGIDLEIEDEADFISSIISEISLVKGEMLSLDHYYAKNCPETVFKQIYEEYDGFLRRSRRIDFDDMLVMCYELLKARPDILAAWQKKYQYILIDEFQDICKTQYAIVRMLAAPENNLFIVGDDDQSIYRFRGAKPEIMLGFEKDYPEAKRILLGTNYRCDANVLSAALRLIGHNQTRFPKEIRAANPAGAPVLTRSFPTIRDENLRIVQDIKAYLAAGYLAEDIAVLYRTNSCPRQLVSMLMEYNLPFCMRDVVPNLYDHWIAGNLYAYMHLAMGSRSRKDFLAVANRPNRYLRRDCFTEAEVEFEQLYRYYEDKEWMLERIEQFEHDINQLKKMAPYAAVNYIRHGIGYEDYLTEYAAFRRMKPGELIEVLDELQESTNGCHTYAEWFSKIAEYNQELKEQFSNRDRKKEGITLATMHSSKGLEYKIVFIIDANEGITPHRKAALEADLEEERRLFYVAMTRAKEHLHIYYTGERYHKKQEPSRFLEEYQ